MATSPNYAWAEPDNSSLVKNGAQDIRALGDAIDTSVWNIGLGQAGKNKIINSDFGIWQRGTSFTFTGSSGFTADRFEGSSGSGGVAVFSRQTFTPGTDPVNGYAGTYYIDANYTTSGTSTIMLENKIEDVTTFANQPVRFSFWAKVSTGTHSVTPESVQRFGSGGSSAVVAAGPAVTLTTAWQRFGVSISVPAITGKTVGAGSSTSFRLNIGTSGVKTFSIWGWQAEYGSKATPFQTASGGSPQAELAMCQRYYWRQTVDSTGDRFCMGMNTTTTNAQMFVQYPVTMRTQPSAIETNGTASDYTISQGATSTACDAVPTFSGATTQTGLFNATLASGLTAGAVVMLRAANANPFIGWSAEL